MKNRDKFKLIFLSLEDEIQRSEVLRLQNISHFMTISDIKCRADAAAGLPVP